MRYALTFHATADRDAAVGSALAGMLCAGYGGAIGQSRASRGGGPNAHNRRSGTESPAHPASTAARTAEVQTQYRPPLARRYSPFPPRVGCLSVAAPSLITMSAELETRSFTTVEDLWSWLEIHHLTHAGLWVVLQKADSAVASVSFHDLLEAGIAYGWSESTRRAHDSTSYLQKFTPRRTRGTMSKRNVTIAFRLEAEGRMTPAGSRALGRKPWGQPPVAAARSAC